MKAMTDKAMKTAAAKLGFRVIVLECSGYKRLVAGTKYMQNGVTTYQFAVETTTMSLPEARAEIVRQIAAAVSK